MWSDQYFPGRKGLAPCLLPPPSRDRDFAKSVSATTCGEHGLREAGRVIRLGCKGGVVVGVRVRVRVRSGVRAARESPWL